MNGNARWALLALVALLAVGAGFYLFAWQVDDSDFAARGWYDTPGMALSAAASSGKPVMVKLGAHT
jgi:hypothetical protein